VKPHVSAFTLAVVPIVFGALSAMAQQAPPTTPKPQAPTPTNAPASASPESTAAAVDPNKYLIGPEDLLFVRTWREPDWTLPAPVRPDGKITIPLVGEIQAGGLTPLQLAKVLTEAIGKYVNSPDVNVFVTDVRSKKYYIDGEVNRPGVFPLVTTITVLEALSSCGGFKEFANKKNIIVLRGSDTKKFNYNEVIKGKNMGQNIPVENGDHIIVK
jgi:polysaccharide export outer membrane protein